MNYIKIENLDIQVIQSITSILLGDARSIERTDTGIAWKGKVQFFDGDTMIEGLGYINNVITANSEASFIELDTLSQTLYGTDYDNITIAESQQVHGHALAGKMVNGLVSADIGFTVGEATELVTAIVTALV